MQRSFPLSGNFFLQIATGLTPSTLLGICAFSVRPTQTTLLSIATCPPKNLNPACSVLPFYIPQFLPHEISNGFMSPDFDSCSGFSCWNTSAIRARVSVWLTDRAISYGICSALNRYFEWISCFLVSLSGFGSSPKFISTSHSPGEEGCSVGKRLVFPTSPDNGEKIKCKGFGFPLVFPPIL